MQDTNAGQVTYANDLMETISWVRIAAILIGVLILLNGIVSAQAPDADFTCTSAGFWSRTISCSDQSTGNPTGWAWFFGDEIYKEQWTLQNIRAEWPARIVNSSVVLSDGMIVIIGGGEMGPSILNDTWSSTDNGIHWSILNPHAEWLPRSGHSSVVMPDGSIVLMGGTYTVWLPYGAWFAMNDTWRSTDNGAHWSLLNSHAEWPARQGHSSVVLSDGSILLTGGFNQWGAPMNDTWRSIDNGAHWSLCNSQAEWPARSEHSTVVIPDGNIILIGGINSYRAPMNDTWRSIDNGAHWSLLNSHAEWPARQGHSSVAMPDASIVLMGGFENGFKRNDSWRSTDNGAHWSLLNSHAEWPARQGHFSVVMPDASIVLMGGITAPLTVMNDTWRFDPVSSRSQNPTHIYSAPGTYNVTLRTYNSQGFSTKQRRITVGLLPFAALIAITGACGIFHTIRKQKR